MRAGDLGGNAFEIRAHLVGHILFRVPEVDVARAALEINHQNMLGFAPAGTTDLRTSGTGGLRAQDVVESQPHHRRPADAQDVTTRKAEMLVAQIFARNTGNAEHKRIAGLEVQRANTELTKRILQ